MRALLPSAEDDIDVHAYYARSWVETGGWRVNFVASVDGAVSAEGRSAGLQTPGDNRIFAALRDLGDVVLVGAGTARTEGYGPARVSADRAARRREFGLLDELPIAVVSQRLAIDPTDPLYTVAPVRTIVLTCAAGSLAVRQALERTADVVICGDDRVDLVAARAALDERGLRRVICEGGPHLFADATRARVVDELCLSMTPFFVGPGPGRIVAGDRFGTLSTLRLIGLLEEEDALFCRYAIDR
jgi:riboflavin biosynthesis pyrimidine reductase